MHGGLARNTSERGLSLLLSTIALVFIIPMTGLIVDVGILYAAKARLQSAVDGAALAAARALVLGASTTAQSDSAKHNAVNWFYANFPDRNWSTSHTVMATGNVSVYDDSQNPNLRHVDLTAQTNVPTYFMKWFNVGSTTISATGHATRRDVVIMMVLDRSTSMNPSSTNGFHDACTDLRDAAKLFTGQFSAGRDRIGMVSFSDGSYVASSPSQNFRTTLGYNTGSSSGNGAIDQVVCNGGTGTAGAVTIAYNELYKTNLPGALNVLVLETDGLPNTLSLDFWDNANSTNKSGLSSTSGCKDVNNKTVASGGWTSTSNRKNWMSAAWSLGGFLGSIGPGEIGNLYSSDRSSETDTTGSFLLLASPQQTGQNVGIVSNPTGYYSSTVPGCTFAGSTHSTETDLARIPRYDVFGNNTYPATDPYKTPDMQDGSGAATTSTASMKYLKFNYGTTNQKWVNYQKGVYNAVDNAAFRARQGYNNTIPALVYVIGLGGNAASTDYTLLQRMANDPTGDVFNTPQLYGAYTMPASFSTQLRGTLVYSANYTNLRRAFLTLSSQILRLSQ